MSCRAESGRSRRTDKVLLRQAHSRSTRCARALMSWPPALSAPCGTRKAPVSMLKLQQTISIRGLRIPVSAYCNGQARRTAGAGPDLDPLLLSREGRRLAWRLADACFGREPGPAARRGEHFRFPLSMRACADTPLGGLGVVFESRQHATLMPLAVSSACRADGFSHVSPNGVIPVSSYTMQ